MTSHTRLLLVRHGQSAWNAAGRWQGQADPPLTDAGRRQAARAADSLDRSFTRVVTSDLARARHTAELIAARLGGLDVVAFTGLRERRAGPWQGLTRDEIEERFPGAIAARAWPEGYEGDELIVERVRDVVRRITEQWAGETILGVAHGGLIRALDRHIGAPQAAIPNLAGRWLAIDAAGDITHGDTVELVDHTIDLGLE